MKLPLNGFRYGIEHEFPVIDGQGKFLDFSNTTFADFDRVIQCMPTYASDYPGLRIGDLGIKKKRWYIEGYERFDSTGAYLHTDAKGFEIRTPICASIGEAVARVKQDFLVWKNRAEEYDYCAADVSFNPFQTEYTPQPPLNAHELAMRSSPEEKTAGIAMLTYGPDISFSHPDFTVAEIIDIGKKLTYYSPFIVPFSFSSPFYDGGLWGGLSRRTYYRTGARPAAMVFLEKKEALLETSPTLTDLARIPAEIGRIEFKAFDMIADVDLYESLLALLLGIALDMSLSGRARVPDGALHRVSAEYGFENENIYAGAYEVIEAARAALSRDLQKNIELLKPTLDSRASPAHAMIDKYKKGKSINEIIRHSYIG